MRLVFGTSELAVATVLAAYMGGLGGRRASPAARRPRSGARCSPTACSSSASRCRRSPSRWRCARAGAARPRVRLPGGPARRRWPRDALLELLTSLAVLIVPTALMGATLPLLARHAVERDDEVGAGSARSTRSTPPAPSRVPSRPASCCCRARARRTVWVAVAANLLVLLGVLALAPRAASEGLSARHPRPRRARRGCCPPAALRRGLLHLRGPLDAPARPRARRGTYAFATMLAASSPASPSARRSRRRSRARPSARRAASAVGAARHRAACSLAAFAARSTRAAGARGLARRRGPGRGRSA